MQRELVYLLDILQSAEWIQTFTEGMSQEKFDEDVRRTTMALSVTAEKAPLRMNTGGVALIGQTRVRLESVVVAFRQGDSPEQIADSFDALTLAEVYGVIAYYLKHREEVDGYLAQQAAAAEDWQRGTEAEHPELFSLRNRLLAR